MEKVLHLIEKAQTTPREDKRLWVQDVWGADLHSQFDREELERSVDLTDDMIPTEDQCGTAGCFAGWTLLELGYLYEKGRSYYDPKSGEPRVDVSRRAAALLGLDDVEADLLFHPDNTLDDLRHIIDGWKREVRT